MSFTSLTSLKLVVSLFQMVTVFRVCFVIEYLHFSVVVDVAEVTFYFAVRIALFVAELTIFSVEKKLQV